ncbi:MAG: hypothetical protein DWQ08_12170 [Proteobacteria bacterium]|nr:MAG: hypothetical protein DWQ08_12170 [Pseudomonadota bacterium]
MNRFPTGGTLIFLTLLALAGTSNSAAAAAVAGEVLMAKGAITATGADDVARFLARGSQVHAGDRVVTADKSFAVISFTDGTRTTLRPSTELLIEKYSHGEGEKSEAVFDLVQGGLRAVSGLIGKENPDNFRVNAQAASMGIRGTAWDVRICEEEDNTCARDNEKITAGKPSSAATFAETKCLDSIDVEGQPPGVYFAVYDGEIFVIRGDEVLELGQGDAGYASNRAFGCLSTFPAFLLGDPIVFPDQIDSGTPDLLELRCE